METTEPVEVMVQEVVVAEIDEPLAVEVQQQQLAVTSPKSVGNEDLASKNEQILSNVDPLGALTVKVDELGENLHQDLAEQKSDASNRSHVDEVINDVVGGYVEIEPATLIKMANEAPTKISPVENERVIPVLPTVSNLKSPDYGSLGKVQKSPDYGSVAKVQQIAAEGLLATAQQQHQDLLMKQLQIQNSTPARSAAAPPTTTMSASATAMSSLSQNSTTPPNQQPMPPFLATSTPTLNQIQNSANVPTPPYPHRVPSSVPPPYAALYDMQIQQQKQAAWAAAGLLTPPTNVMQRTTTSANVLEQEFQLREQQARFLAEQQRQVAVAAAAAQRISSASSVPNYSQHQQNMIAGGGGTHVNDALMNHRWLLEVLLNIFENLVFN